MNAGIRSFVRLLVCTAMLLAISMEGYAQTQYLAKPCSEYKVMSEGGVLAGRRIVARVPQVLIRDAANPESETIVLHVPNAWYIKVFSVNDSRLVVAEAILQGELDRRLILLDGNRADAAPRELSLTKGQSFWECTINNKGIVVGTIVRKDERRAALWDTAKPNAGPIFLATPEQCSSGANAINEEGLIAGTVVEKGRPKPVLWDAKRPSSAPTYLAITADSGIAVAVNDKGLVAGSVTTNDGSYAVLWDAHNPRAAPKTLAAYPPNDLNPDFLFGKRHYHALTMNNRGTVIGFHVTYTEQEPLITTRQSYVLWDDANNIMDLDSKLKNVGKAAETQRPWEVKAVQGINSRGEILVECGNGNGAETFLLTPSRQ